MVADGRPGRMETSGPMGGDLATYGLRLQPGQSQHTLHVHLHEWRPRDLVGVVVALACLLSTDSPHSAHPLLPHSCWELIELCNRTG